jgi:lipopolysaccharide biosynthesis glycosyltransferase
MPEYLSSETPGKQQLINNTPIAEEEQIIPLLEERMFVDKHKQKLGEVIVRKQIETQMIQVPIRREKLIIEQLSPEHQQLAEIDLGEGVIADVIDELTTSKIPEVAYFDSDLIVSGEFSSPKIASLLLNAIALEKDHGCQEVKLTILVEKKYQQKKYQEWFNRCSQS